MFFFVGGIGPQEAKTDMPGAQCPACGSPSVQEKRIDQVSFALGVVPPAATVLLMHSIAAAGAVCVLCASHNSPEGNFLSSLQCLWLGLEAG